MNRGLYHEVHFCLSSYSLSEGVTEKNILFYSVILKYTGEM